MGIRYSNLRGVIISIGLENHLVIDFAHAIDV